MSRHVLHCMVVGSFFRPWPLMVGLLRCDLRDFPVKDFLYSAERYAGNVRIISKDSSFVTKLRACGNFDHSEVFLRKFYFISPPLKWHLEIMDRIFRYRNPIIMRIHSYRNLFSVFTRSPYRFGDESIMRLFLFLQCPNMSWSRYHTALTVLPEYVAKPIHQRPGPSPPMRQRNVSWTFLYKHLGNE